MKIVKNTAIILLWFCHTRMINIKPRPQRLQFLYYIPPIHCAWLIFRTLGDIKQRFQNLLRELWLSNCWASWSFSFRISKNLCIIPKMKKKKSSENQIPNTNILKAEELVSTIWSILKGPQKQITMFFCRDINIYSNDFLLKKKMYSNHFINE